MRRILAVLYTRFAGAPVFVGMYKSLPALYDTHTVLVMITIPTMNSPQQATSIETPPDCVPALGPVDTVSQVLPFGELTWENFERLCHRLASQDDEVEHSARYGLAGQTQQGIDIFARKKNGKYDTWQAKRYLYTTTAYY